MSIPSWQSLVTVHWFIVDRKEPIIPYPTVIQGYLSLTTPAHIHAELMVNEFFRESEYRQLCDYIQKQHRKDVRTSMLTTPVPSIKPDSSTSTGRLRPFGQPVAEQRETVAIYRLSEEKEYSLPFTVWGAYNELAHTHPGRAEAIANRLENERHEWALTKDIDETETV